LHDATLLVDRLLFPECPRWRDGRLFFSDVWAHEVRTVDLDGNVRLVASFEDRPSGLGFLADGTLIVALMRTRQLVAVRDGVPAPFADLSALPGDFINDMLTDPRGRSYVGLRFDGGGEDRVVLVNPDGDLRVVVEAVDGPNGAVLTEDGSLILAETRGLRLSRFALAPDGSATRRELFADTAPASPDGICLDGDEAVWIASPATGEFLRILEGGEVTQRIAAPEGVKPLACALGGELRRTLFMLSARLPFDERGGLGDLTDVSRDGERGAEGWIHTAEVAIAGAGWQ
jgi:sugar lactone lactonase YvrE